MAYKLTRIGDRLIKQSSDIKWIEFNENGRFKEDFSEIKEGRSLLMSPFNMFYTWQTTSVTEILEQTENVIRFKTKNSEYKLEKNV